MGARGPKPTPVIQRLLARVRVDPSGCWIYEGSINPVSGYGYITCNKDEWPCRTASVHKVAYHFLVGPVPEGLVIDHLCAVRACVRPTHLEPVTMGENTERGGQPHLTKRSA